MRVGARATWSSVGARFPGIHEYRLAASAVRFSLRNTAQAKLYIPHNTSEAQILQLKYHLEAITYITRTMSEAKWHSPLTESVSQRRMTSKNTDTKSETKLYIISR